MRSGGKHKPAIKMGGHFWLTYSLMKWQFSILILSGSFPIFDLKNRGVVWAFISMGVI